MDSDDENDRRRRDKFRRERSDYSDRRERDNRRRDDWSDRRRRDTRDMRDWNRRDYQDRGRRDRYSPPPRDLSPPSKRMRRDWDSGGGYSNYNMPYGGGGGNQGYGGHPQGHGGWGSGGGMQHMQPGPHHGNQGPRGGPDHDHGRGGPHGPHIMSFKQFLASQDDMIDDTEAVRKYNEYKVEFKRTQLSEFFLAHKEEEWFRSKYYPDEADKRKAEGLMGVKRRQLVFLELYEGGWMEKLRLQSDRTEEISRVLDAAVIKMEGGTPLDLKALDQQFLPPRRRMTSESLISVHSPRGKVEVKKEKEEVKEEKPEGKAASVVEEEKKSAVDKKPDITGEITSPKKEDASETHGEGDKDVKTNGEEKVKGGQEKRGKKRKRHRDSDYENDSGSSSGSSSSSSGSESESEPEPAPPGMDDDVLPSDKLEEDKEAEKARREAAAAAAAEEDDGELKEGEKEGEDEEEGEELPTPRPLHKTYSLFIRNVAPMITKGEIISLCKRYQGFMRVALAEPQPERNFQRHGWVTFDRSVNIKEICWNLSSIRLRECELSPVVNRDLANRIRGVSGITAHKKIVRADLKLAARLVQQLDEKLRLWHPEDEARLAREAAEKKRQREEKRKEEEKKKREEEKKEGEEGEKEEGLKEGSEEEEKEPERIIIPAKYKSNPVLENITDYLVEEVSAEEDALMGAKPEEEGEETSGEVLFLRDDELNKVLDRLLIYLRIVHSVDYYNTSQYHIEDEMPNRCGIMHTRGHNPPSRITHKDLTNWIANFEIKLSNLLNAASNIPDEELVKLGKKDPEAEVEKFVKANTQEIGKDKWLCPLSGKKFKGPEFVRKHIFNKHSDKVDDVRKEVTFFNNYLKDPNRPQLPEPQAQKPPGPGDRPNQSDMQGGGGGGSGGMGYQQQQQQQFGGPMMGYGGQQQGGNFGNNRGFNPGHQFGHQQQQPAFQRGGYGGGFNRQRNRFTKRGDQQSTRKDPRHIVNYRDLDAPNDDDFF